MNIIKYWIYKNNVYIMRNLYKHFVNEQRIYLIYFGSNFYGFPSYTYNYKIIPLNIFNDILKLKDLVIHCNETGDILPKLSNKNIIYVSTLEEIKEKICNDKSTKLVLFLGTNNNVEIDFRNLVNLKIVYVCCVNYVISIVEKDRKSTRLNSSH